MRRGYLPSGGIMGLLIFLALDAQAIHILVNHEPFESPIVAAFSEAEVNWLDADSVDDITCTECFAAAELQKYLRRIQGQEEGFDLKDDKVLPEGDVILIGGPASNKQSRYFCQLWNITQEELDALGPGGYRIYSSREEGARYVLMLAGADRVGTLYAVYDVLYGLGVRWFAPGDLHEEVPSMQLHSLPHLDETVRPAFLFRGFHAWEDRGNPEFLLWMARNRLNYWCVEQKEQDLMNKLGIHKAGGGHVMTPDAIFPNDPYPFDHPGFQSDKSLPEDPYPISPYFQGDVNGDGILSYFEAHPEWYALVDGKRSSYMTRDGMGHNYCTSNEHATRELTRKTVEELWSGRYKNADILNCWMLDVGKWCTCEACVALGSHTDRNLLVVYELDKAIKEAQSQGSICRPITLLFLAYADVLEPPTRPLPSNFDYTTCIATYFPIVRCYVHPFNDPSCSRNQRYGHHLLGWATDPNRYYKGQLCIGEYYNVSGYKCLPACFRTTMTEDIPHYHELGARYFHYMHCTTENWGNKALTNYQMAQQLWNPNTNVTALFREYLRGRYGKAASEMKSFYEHLEPMLCNVSEIKYGLAKRLDKGASALFTDPHLLEEPRDHVVDRGPSWKEILEHRLLCREALAGALAREIPDRIRLRIEEDERLFAYGERTLLFYDAAIRVLQALREDRIEDAMAVRKELMELADLLREDTSSTRYSSSHANAVNALDATGSLGIFSLLEDALGPRVPAKCTLWMPQEEPLMFRGRDFSGGGALRYGYHLHVFPERIQVSDNGNFVYGEGTCPYDRLIGWFRLETLPSRVVTMELVGLNCPSPPGGTIQSEISLNDRILFRGNMPFPERELGSMIIEVPVATFQIGENRLEIRNLESHGQVGGRPWLGIDRVLLSS